MSNSTDPKLLTLQEQLRRATGGVHWAPAQAGLQWLSAPLETFDSTRLAQEFTDLDTPFTAVNAGAGKVSFMLRRGDAINFIEAEGRDRPHVDTDIDPVLLYLQTRQPAFVWVPTEDGYLGEGFDQTRRAALLAPFLQAGVRPQSREVESIADGTSEAIFLSTEQANRFIDARNPSLYR